MQQSLLGMLLHNERILQKALHIQLQCNSVLDLMDEDTHEAPPYNVVRIFHGRICVMWQIYLKL